MNTQPDRNVAPNLFGDISEADRNASLDEVGKLLIAARDRVITQWDQIIAGNRKYAPWERVVREFPNLDQHSRGIARAVLPHIVDSFLYCLLAELDASQTVRVSVMSGNQVVTNNVARISWGLPAEPTGEKGWLARFSKQRFEQPY